MAGTLYDIGIVTPIANIAAALEDKYGVYNDPANLNGYEELFESTEYLVFKCAAIAGNKVIKLRWYASLTLWHSWGTAWTSGSTVTGELPFGCTDTNTNRTHATIRLILHDETYFLVTSTTLSFSEAGSMAIIIGELSNGGYGVAGFMACTNSGSVGNALMYYLDTGVVYWPMMIPGECTSLAGKLYEQNVTFMYATTHVPLVDSLGELVYFLNVTNVGHNGFLQNPILGANFIISGGYLKLDDHPSTVWLATSTLMCLFTPAP